MSNLKPRFLTALPLDSEARLPGLLLLLLAGGALVQLVLPDAVALPDAAATPAGFGEGAGRQAPPPMPGVAVPPILPARLPFTPVLARAADDAPPDPLAGAVVAGTVQRGAVRVAVVQTPGGRLRYVAPGGLVAGWRIDALDPDRVRLGRGKEHLDIAYGEPAVAPHAPSSKPKADDDQ